MKPAEATKLAKRLLQIHGLFNWNCYCRKKVDLLMLKLMERGQCGYNSAGEPWGFAGLCVRKYGVILLSPTAVDGMSHERARQVILHEIAHALADTDGHHAEWRAIAKRIGCKEAEEYEEGYATKPAAGGLTASEAIP